MDSASEIVSWFQEVKSRRCDETTEGMCLSINAI